jgi:hypothetical protein
MQKEVVHRFRDTDGMTRCSRKALDRSRDIELPPIMLVIGSAVQNEEDPS